MSRSKVSILSKYVMAIAILALLFSVAITSARYAVSSYGSSSIGIESFDVDVALYDEDGNEVSGDITLDDKTENLSSYTKVYYLYINNNDKDTLYYKIEEQSGNFCFKVGEETTRYTTYAGSLGTTSTTALTLTVSLRPDVTVSTGETQSLSISLYAEYQHTEAYESETVTEPEPEPEDENHTSTDGWVALNSSNIGSALNVAGKYYLSEDITVSSTLTLVSGSTLCLNGHTLTGSSLSPLISVTNGNVTIQDCIGNGSISGASQGVSVASGATLTLEGKLAISSNTTNVYLATGAYISLGELEEGANIGVTSASSISDSNSVQITSTEESTYYYESAIKYIHSDNSDYKVSAGHSGYLSLIGKGYINLTIALHGTDGTTANIGSSGNDRDGKFHIDGGTGYTSNDSDTPYPWLDADASYYCQRSMADYSGYYSSYYEYYFDFGSTVPTTYDFTFGISPYTWESNLYDWGLAPSSSSSFPNSYENAKAENFGLWATQYNSNSGTNTNSIWTLGLWNANNMDTIGDLTVILELDYSSLNFSWSANNVVSNVTFIANGSIQAYSFS